jgi:leucyl aminopeptidase
MGLDILRNIEIDKFALDTEAQRQPELIRKYGILYAKSKSKTAQLKRKLEVIEAEEAEKVKSEPDEYDVSPNRQGNVSDVVAFKIAKGTKTYIKAFNDFLAAKEKEEEYGIIMDSLKDRGYMIKNLVELWLNNYYSDINLTETTTRRSNQKKRLNLSMSNKHQTEY